MLVEFGLFDDVGAGLVKDQDMREPQVRKCQYRHICIHELIREFFFDYVWTLTEKKPS